MTNQIKRNFLTMFQNALKGHLQAFRDNILNKKSVHITSFCSLNSGAEKRLYLNEDCNIVLCQQGNCIEFSLADWYNFNQYVQECLP